MKRRDLFKTAAAGLLGLLWPWEPKPAVNDGSLDVFGPVRKSWTRRVSATIQQAAPAGNPAYRKWMESNGWTYLGRRTEEDGVKIDEWLKQLG